jgi:prevent-host-death family protein
MSTPVGAYEAKTRLPELLRQVREGRRFTITNRGEAIADLVPSESGAVPDACSAIERFQSLMRQDPPAALHTVAVKALIDEGRG